MKIVVNGEDRTVEGESISVAELLVLERVEQPDMVSVQRNGEFVERDAFTSEQVKTLDTIDFLYFMGGGAQ